MASTARLRKAFKYPSGEDEDEPQEGIDEEEQEKLITTIHAQDAAKTAFYTKCFLALPLLSTLIYIPSLLLPSSIHGFLTSLLSTTSLLCTAFTLYYLPLSPDPNDPRNALMQRYLPGAADDGGPLRKYIVPLNGLLCGILALGSLTSEVDGGDDMVVQSWLGRLPMVAFGLVLFVRAQLRPVGTDELEKLRYRYKGA